MTHGQTLRAYLDWCDWAGPAHRRPLPDREPVLPHLRVQGRLPRLAHARRHHLPARGVRRPAVVLDLVAARADHRVPRRADDLPVAPRLPRPLARTTSRRLRLAVTGAADIPVELIRRVARGAPVRAHPHRLRPHRGRHRHREHDPTTTSTHIASTVGVPWPGFDGAHGRHRAAARSPSVSPARSCVRGETVMRGYLDDPDATAAAFDADGFLHTGDLGTIDADGYLRIVGRIKDMFIVGGFNAYPAEIENLLLATRGSRRPRSSASPTSASARWAWPSWCCATASPLDRRRHRRVVARPRWPTSRCPAGSSSSTSSPSTPPARSSRTSCERMALAKGDALMAQVPVAEGVFTFPSDEPQLIGSGAPTAGSSPSPARRRAPAAGRPTMEEHLLARRGRCGRGRRRRSRRRPAVRGPDAARTSCRSASATSSSGGEVKVESRLTENDPDEARARAWTMELVLVPFRTDDDGNEVVTFAFRPVG